MTYKQIETSREIRLWISQIIVPAIVAGTVIVSNPTAKKTVTDGAKSVKNFVADKVKKLKES